MVLDHVVPASWSATLLVCPGLAAEVMPIEVASNHTRIRPSYPGQRSSTCRWLSPLLPSPTRHLHHLPIHLDADLLHYFLMRPPANLLAQNSSTQSLGQAIGDVVFTLDKPDLPNLGSRSFVDSMVANTQMLLVQLGLGNGGTTPHPMTSNRWSETNWTGLYRVRLCRLRLLVVY